MDLKKKYPKITIVTPSYNQGEYLERTILSVLSQNYPNLEYIIIDGGSTDNSVKIIKKYAKFLAYWVSEPDKGQTDAIQKGFSKSTGEIMCWLNSDDVHYSYTLEFVSQIFTKYPSISWLTGQHTSISPQDVIIQTGLFTGKNRLLIRLGFYHGKGLSFIPQEATFWRKTLWQKCDSFMEDAKYSMDYKLWKRFAKYTSLVTIEAPLAAFRLNPNRKTKSLDQYHREINPLLPYIPKYIAILPRILHPLFLRWTSPRLVYNRQNDKWIFKPGLFFKPLNSKP